ncbi:MAG: zinc ribbon domain-containing protein [Desulfobacteraceae bacterium]|nr:MAG: zinc ribbon domain-containing protein [Desulfobacteraceae bacterium]
MPIFEYQCSHCSHTFEKLVFKGEEGGIECPECQKQDVKKLMSAVSFMGSSIGTCAADAPKGFG